MNITKHLRHIPEESFPQALTALARSLYREQQDVWSGEYPISSPKEALEILTGIRQTAMEIRSTGLVKDVQANMKLDILIQMDVNTYVSHLKTLKRLKDNFKSNP